MKTDSFIRVSNPFSEILHFILLRSPNVSYVYTLLVHVRRGDFHDQFKTSILSADDLFQTGHSILQKHNVTKTLFIASDEKNRTYFSKFDENYKIFFLGDFLHVLDGVNSNYFPLIDQLIAARGDVFIGTNLSTFTSYINRLRGYYSLKGKMDGHEEEEGKIQSYYFSPKEVRHKYRGYFAIHEPLWAYEFPEAWFNLDKDIM